VIAASTKGEEPFPAHTEAQIGGFTELVATAIANAQARQELQRVAEEQATLRRVATLVARGMSSAAATIRARDAATSVRDSVFAIAVATSSVNSAICDSVSGGNGVALVDEAAITPHSRPSTRIGQPTDDRIPRPSASRAIGPTAPAKLVTRTGPLASQTIAATLAPCSENRVPTASPGTSPRLQPATPTTLSPDS